MMSAKLRLVVAFLLPLLAIASAFDPFHQNMPQMEPKMAMGGGQPPFIPHEYVRSADVKRQCRSVLSSATELTFDASRANALMPELTFVKGDWKQDDGGVPLMPFDGTDVSGDDMRLTRCSWPCSCSRTSTWAAEGRRPSTSAACSASPSPATAPAR